MKAVARGLAASFFAFVLLCPPLFAQAPPTAQAAPAPPAKKAKVFVTDSQSWSMAGGSGYSNGSGGGGVAGGARPQTAEIIKTFEERCPQVQINNRPDHADYVVELDHEGGKSVFAHKDKVVVFDRRTGDSIGSKSTLSVGGSVENACNFIAAHWTVHSAEMDAADAAAAAPARAPDAAASAPPTGPVMSQLTISSEPAGADIEIDGAFVGSTPSTISQSLGDKQITVTKKGYTAWTRKMRLTGGDVHVNAELEPAK